MIRIFKQTEIFAKDRLMKGFIEFGLTYAKYNYIPEQIYNFYPTLTTLAALIPITTFNIVQVDENYKIINTISQSNLIFIKVSGQIQFNTDVYFSPILEDGIYYYYFVAADGLIYHSELFGVCENTKLNKVFATDIKNYQDDPIFEYD